MIWPGVDPCHLDNAAHVVTGTGVDRTAVIDGFTITAGYNVNGNGAGMLNDPGSPTVINCTFRDNCAFPEGGGSRGGGMYNGPGSSPLVGDCTFVGNQAAGGAGIMNMPETSPTLVNCVFRSNMREAVFNSNCTRVTVRDCTFVDHHGISGGGAMISTRTDVELTGCLFCGNSARAGGAVFVGDTHLIATNCTFAQNHAELGGAAIYTHRNVTGEIRNCIFWGNTAANSPQMTVYKASHIAVSHCNIEGGRSTIAVLLPEDTVLVWGPGNIDVDPLFADPGHWDPSGRFWTDGDYHLSSQAGRWDAAAQSWSADDVTSPCIDAGDPGSPVGREPAPNGGRVNMGVYGGTAEASMSPEAGPTPGLWSEPVPLAEVNLDSAEEWSPVLSADGLTLYFGRVHAPGQPFGRIFQASRQSALPYSRFTAVAEIPGALNRSEGDVLCPWVSPDGLHMYYTLQSGSVFSLMVSERPADLKLWPIGREIRELNQFDGRLRTCRLTADELTVFFTGPDIHGGSGEYDIWMATRPDRDAPFDEPLNLATLNSAHNDIHANPSSDGLALYFASNRSGRYQLLKSMRESRAALFGPPAHMTLFDTPDGHSMFPYLVPDGTEFYFMRETAGGRGTRDIWVSYRID